MGERFDLDLDTILNRRYRVAERIDPTRTALLVIDMQKFFLRRGQPAYLPGGDGAPSAETVVENFSPGARPLPPHRDPSNLLALGPQG